MKRINWSWLIALRMLVTALLPVTFILTGNVELGLIASIGVIPAAVVPMSARKSARVRIVIIGVVFAVSIVVGSLLSQNVVIAVFGIAALAFGAAYLTSTRLKRVGGLGIAMAIPVVAIGFSYPDIGEALMLGLVIILGSAWALLVALLFPSLPEKADTVAGSSISRKQAIIFGIGYGAAGALATAVPFVLGWDHVGWVAGAALFVMRPGWLTQKNRMAGRLASVLVGALLASIALALSLSPGVVAVLMAFAIIFAGATQGSRWYITPLFSTYIVFFVLLYVNHADGDIQYRFNERVIETLIGVGIAGIFGFILSYIARRSS